jgi:acetyl-CoA carboxylase biotin carboxyl carrier protein
MTYKEITDLIKLVNKTDLAEVKLEDGDFKLSIRSKDFRSKGSAFEMPGPPINYSPISAMPPASASPVPETKATGTSSQAPEGEKENAGSSELIEIKSPIVGTFYRSSSPEKPAYAKVGDSVEVGDIVCIVEAMKLFNEIESEVSGTIVKVVVEDASPVEYDQVLFLVDPS